LLSITNTLIGYDW